MFFHGHKQNECYPTVIAATIVSVDWCDYSAIISGSALGVWCSRCYYMDCVDMAGSLQKSRPNEVRNGERAKGGHDPRLSGGGNNNHSCGLLVIVGEQYQYESVYIGYRLYCTEFGWSVYGSFSDAGTGGVFAEYCVPSPVAFCDYVHRNTQSDCRVLVNIGYSGRSALSVE